MDQRLSDTISRADHQAHEVQFANFPDQLSKPDLRHIRSKKNLPPFHGWSKNWFRFELISSWL